jgi:streptogramin lyase
MVYWRRRARNLLVALAGLAMSCAASARAVTIDEFPIGATPTGIVAGVDGDVYVTTTAPSILRVSAVTGQVLARYPLTQLGAGAPSSPIFAGGALWFALSDASLGRRTADGTIAQFAVPAHRLAPGPSGDLWTDVGRVDLAGNITVPVTFPGWISAVATDASGQLWGVYGHQTYKATPTGQVSDAGLPVSARNVAASPASDDVWFLGRDEYNIYGVTWADYAYLLTPGATGSRFGTGFLGTSDARDIAVGRDGNAWVTDAHDPDQMLGEARVGRVTPRGRSTAFAVGLAADAQPGFIAEGPGDTMWFTDPAGGGRIGRVSFERPSTTTEAASEVGQTGADVAAVVTPRGVTTRVRFAYGRTEAYGETTRWVDVGEGDEGVRRTARLDALEAGTTYHYRAEITSAFGVIGGPDRTVTTAPIPPPPPVPPADADGDGYAAGVDCDDQSANISPGATDVAGDGIDQDCSGSDERLPRFFPHIAAFFLNRKGHWSRASELTVDDLPAGAGVQLRCRGGGCSFTRWSTTVRRDTPHLRLLKRLRASKLHRGAVLELRLTLAGHVGTVVRWTVGPPPKPKVTCLVPGAAKETKC